MIDIFKTVSFRHLLREPLRTLLILFGIALGVAVFVSIRIANVSALAAFRSTLTVVSGPANLIVRGSGAPLPDAVFPQVWRLPGVKGASPRVEATLPLGDPSRSPTGEFAGSLMILGVDPFTQADLDALNLKARPRPEAQESGLTPDTRFFTRPDAVLLTDRFARRHGLSEGSVFRVTVSGTPKELHVLGVLPPGDLSNAYGGDVGLMDIAAAQELLGRVGRLDRIDVFTAPEDEERVADAIRRLLPPGVTVGPPSQRMRQAEQMVSAFQLNLTALSLISALVGVFIIYNALLISVLKRRREIATLRSVGVTRGGIVALFLAEAGLLGLAGSALGLLLGAWLARFTLGAVSETISVLYLRVQARELVVTPEDLILGALLGLGTALAAGLAPALEAASTSPAVVLRQATAAEPTRRRALPWFLAGLALLAFAGLASIAPGLRESRFMGFAGAFALLLGAALMTPALIVGLGPFTQAAYHRLFGVKGELAAHEVRAALDRSAAVIAALGVAVAMLIGLAIMVGSFRRTVEIWVDNSLHADLFIGPAGQAVSGEDSVLPQEVVAAVRSLPGVVAVDSVRSRQVTVAGRPTALLATDMAVHGRYSREAFREGNSREILTGMAREPGVVVSEPFERRTGLAEGDEMSLVTPSGRVSLTIRGVFYDYTSDAGVVMIDQSLYRRYWGDDRISNVALHLEPGVSAAQAREALLRRLGDRYHLQIANNRELRENVLDIFDQTFAITYALQIIAFLVAMLGIGNALLAILLQRQREIGILRAIGASKGQIVGISLLEAGLLATWGHLVGMLSGILLAVHLVYVINRQFFGWTLQFRITPEPFLISYLVVLAAALVAAIYPAAKAARVRVAEAVRTE